MTFGIAFMIIGYAIFYWGLHHMPQYTYERYSLWVLLGFGTLFKTTMPAGTPVQFNVS